MTMPNVADSDYRYAGRIMPCGRCRQLLFEHGGPDLALSTVSGVKAMRDVLPEAFGPDALDLA